MTPDLRGRLPSVVLAPVRAETEHAKAVLVRVRALLRRLDMPMPRSRAPSFRAGDLEMDFNIPEVRLRGEVVQLTPTEYKLLYHLVRNAGRTLTHGTLLAKVWGREYVDEVDYLRVYVRRLRDKLGDDPERPRYIRTERGLGYRFFAGPPEPRRVLGD